MPKDVNAAIQNIKKSKSVEFVAWSPTGFKVNVFEITDLLCI